MKQTLLGIQIAIASGHTPDGQKGSGAEGEKAWNDILVDHLASQLRQKGADVYIHTHQISSYGERQDVFAAAVRNHCPDCKVVLELHYNSFNGSAKGHEFLYGHTPALAKAIQTRFAERFPKSTPRSGGTKQVLSGNGSGFLIKAPAASCLPEPFFGDNPNERDVFEHAQAAVASTYIAGIEDYLGVTPDETPEPDPMPTEPPSIPATLAERVANIEDHLKYNSHFLPL